MDKLLIIFGFPLPPMEFVQSVLQGRPERDYLILGQGITAEYLTGSSLGEANIFRPVLEWKKPYASIKAIRAAVPDTALFIGQSSDLVGPALAILSGARIKEANFFPVPEKSQPRRIGFIPTLVRAFGRLVLFLITLPVWLIPALFLSGRTKKLPPPELPVRSSPVEGDKLPPVSLVIPNFNGKKLLSQCLPSLLTALAEYPAGGEIVLVDDASSDGSEQWIRDNFSSVRVIALRENQGFGRAVNRGIASSSNRMVVLLNSDITVDAGFLSPLIKHFHDPELFAVQPRMNTWTGDGLDLGVNVGRMENGYIRIWNERESGNQAYLNYSAPNLYAVGGAMAFDKEKWDLLGGFDDIYYPFCWEDIDISYRAAKRGWKVLYEPESLVNHLHYGTISRFFAPEYKRIIEARNELLFIWKNIHSRRLWRAHLNRIPILLLGSLLNGNMIFYKAFWRAALEILPLLQKRKEEISYSRIDDQEVFR